MNQRTGGRFFEGVGVCLRWLAFRTRRRRFKVLFACATVLALLVGGIVLFRPGVPSLLDGDDAIQGRPIGSTGISEVPAGSDRMDRLLAELRARSLLASGEEGIPEAPGSPAAGVREAAPAILGALEVVVETASSAAPREALLVARARALRAAILTEGLRRVRTAEEEILRAIEDVERAPTGAPGEAVLAAWEEIAQAAERTTRLDEAEGAWGQVVGLARTLAPPRAARAEAALARLARRRGRLDDAEERLTRLRGEAWARLPRAVQAAALLDHGDVARARHRHALALARHGEAAARLEEEPRSGSPLGALVQWSRALVWIDLESFEEAVKDAATAAEMLEAAGCDIPAARARVTLASALIGGKRDAEAASSLLKAQGLLEAASPGPEDAVCLFLGAEVSLGMLGPRLAIADLDGAVEDLRRATRWRRLGGRGVPHAMLVQRIAEGLAMLGHAAEAEEEVRAFLSGLECERDAGRPASHDAMQGRCELALAAVESRRARPAAAAGCVARARTRLRRGGDLAGDAEALLRGTAIHADLGLWSLVDAGAAEYRDHASPTPRGLACADALAGRAALARGDAPAALSALAAAGARARGLGDALLAARVRIIEGVAFERAGRKAEARSAYAEAASLGEDLRERDLWAEATLRCVILECGSGKEARELVEVDLHRLEALLEEPVIAADPARVRRLELARGRALAGLGDEARAREALAAAAAQSPLDLPAGLPEEAIASRLEQSGEALGDLLLDLLRRAAGAGADAPASPETGLAAWEALDHLRGRSIDAVKSQGERTSRATDFPRDRLRAARLRLSLTQRDPSLAPEERGDLSRELLTEILAAEVEIRTRWSRGAPPAPPWSPRRQMEALEAGDAVLATVLGAREAYVLVLRRHGAFVLRIDRAPQEVAVLARQLIEEVSGRGTGVEQVAAQLSAALLHPAAPLLGGVEKLWVASDPRLALVPIGVLRLPDGRRLVESFEVTHLAAPRGLAKATRGACVVHPPPANGMARRKPRPFLVAIGGAAAVEATRLLEGSRTIAGPEASEARFRAEAGRGEHLFVAARAGAGKAAPLLDAGIALAPGGGRSTGNADDGLVTALEAADLDLRGVMLAVLSGRSDAGDSTSGHPGILGLERAFLAAGARSVIATRWDAGDEATVRIVAEILGGIRSGLEPAAALRVAQLKCLRGEISLDAGSGGAGPRLDHPFYWAGLSLTY